MVQTDRFGSKVGSHLAPCCIHHVNQGELSQYFKHDDSTIKIVLAYTGCGQKHRATLFYGLTLEILNKSLPNLAQIKVTSF